MEQQIVKCPKCETEIGEVEFYKYHRRCKNCWNAYCKTKRYPNKEVNKRSMLKYKAAHPVTERYCKCCKETKPIDSFDPRKHYCKECYRSPAEIKKAYQQIRKEQLKVAKAKWYENNKEREREKKKAAYRANVGYKPIKPIKVKTEKVKPIRVPKAPKVKAPKVKPVRIKKQPIIKQPIVTQFEVTVRKKNRDVRPGWDKTIAELRAKFQTA